MFLYVKSAFKRFYLVFKPKVRLFEKLNNRTQTTTLKNFAPQFTDRKSVV